MTIENDEIKSDKSPQINSSIDLNDNNPPKLTDYFNNVPVIMKGSYSKVEPPEEDYSTFSNLELMDEYAPSVFDDSLTKQLPLVEQELLFQSEYQYYFLLRGLGGGKSTVAIRHIRNRMLKFDRPALSFIPSRGVGEAQKEKFWKDSGLLNDTICRCVTYYGSNDENSQIRESSLDHTLIITTPFMYAGTLTHYSPMISKEHLEFFKTVKDPEAWQGLFGSENSKWAQTLMSPSVIFIDEVDSFPLATLYCLVVIVRLLISRNPDLQVILASGTISNPDDIANLLFGPNANYLPIKGTGRRGESSIDVFYEEKEHHLLHQAIKAIKSYIEDEIKSLDLENLENVPTDFDPAKCILFINDKLEIDIREIIGDFNDFFITLHGNMNPEELTTQIDAFNTNPLKICLVSTDIIHAGFDPSNVVWGIFYGLPFSRRAFIQRRHRIIRKSHKKSHIDLILRPNNQDEQILAEPGKEDSLEAYIYQEEPPPFNIPFYTPLILKYALVMGLVFGNWRIIDNLRYFVDDDNHPFFKQDLQRTYSELLADNVFAQAPNGMIRPTKRTKKWIWSFPKQFESNIFTVVLSEKNGRTRTLGKISYLHLLRYSLPTQTLPFIDNNYIVSEIRKEEKEVYVSRGIQELHYYKNKINYSNRINKIICRENTSSTALVEILMETYVSEIDRRTKLINIDDYSIKKVYLGVFIPTDLTKQVTQQLNGIYQSFNMGSSLIKNQTINDEQLGKGTLLIDRTGLHFAWLIYFFWSDLVSGSQIHEEEVK